MHWIIELHPILLGALQVAALGAPACALALLLRRAGIPGGAPAGAIVGGLVAGLLVGASVGGRVMPETHDRLYVGGVDAVIALADRRSEHARERMALQATGVSLEAMPELEVEQRREVEDAVAHIDVVRADHGRRLRIAGMFVFALVGATGVGACTRRRWRVAIAQVPAMVIGAVLACAATVLITRLIGVEWKLAAAFGVICAVPGLPRHLVGPRSAVLPFGAMWRWWLPSCVALLASVIDLPELVREGRFWWLLALGVVASSDLRWVCAWAAIRGTASRWWARYPWSMASRWMRDGASSVQIVLAFLMFGLDRNLDDLIAAVLAGAAVIELTRNLRSRVGALLDRASLTGADHGRSSVS